MGREFSSYPKIHVNGIESKSSVCSLVEKLALLDSKSYACALKSRTLYVNISSILTDVIDDRYMFETVVEVLSELVKRGYKAKIWGKGYGITETDYVKEKYSGDEYFSIIRRDGYDKNSFQGFVSGTCFIIEGIEDTYLSVLCKDIVGLKKKCKCFVTEYGSVLIDPKERGRLYRDGIFDKYVEGYNCGWNLKYGHSCKEVYDALSKDRKTFVTIEGGAECFKDKM